MGRNRRKKDANVHGILLVDKPAGITSFDVVARLRRVLKTSRIGHTGTLDPFATGLLVVLIGQYTRLCPYLTAQDKRYLATAKLGEATNTDDKDGEVIATAAPDALAAVDDAAIEAALVPLRGPIAQIPPMFAAISVDGERLYEKARRGEVVEREARHVTIASLTHTGGAPLLPELDVTCSKGTYIRAIARDVGEALGVGGHLVALRRLASGPYHVDEATTLADIEAHDAPLSLLRVGPDAILGMPKATVDARQTAMLRQGKRPTWPEGWPTADVVLTHHGDELVAMVRRDGDVIRVVRGFAQPVKARPAVTHEMPSV